MPIDPDLFYPRHGEAVTLHDSNPNRFCGLYIGTGGTLILRLADDSVNITLNNVANGSFFPLQTELVVNTGTTASGIIGFRLRGV